MTDIPPQGMPCAQCGRKDDEVDLFAHIMSSILGKKHYVLLHCKECLANPETEQLKSYKIPVYCPSDKQIKIKVVNK